MKVKYEASEKGHLKSKRSVKLAGPIPSYSLYSLRSLDSRSSFVVYKSWSEECSFDNVGENLGKG